MKHYGISDNALSWFLSYLIDRSQVVRCKGKLSNPANLNIGVPQGTILGPIFFIIFVNDLPYYIGTLSGLMYADDTTLKAAANTHKQVQNKLQQLTDKTMNWLRNNRLVVNPNKSSVMLIGTRQKINDNNEIFVNDILINQCKCVKILGLQVDSSLTFANHIEYVCKKSLPKAWFVKEN